MCSENTPLRLTNGVLGVFLLTNSIKIVLKRVGGFVKQMNDNLTIIDDLKKLDNRNQEKNSKIISIIFHGFYCMLKNPEEKALFFRVVLVYNLVVIYCTGITHQFCTCYKLFVLIY